MHKQLGSPIEKIGLAGFELCRSLILLSCLQRFAAFFLHITGEVMEFRTIIPGKQRLDLGLRQIVLTGVTVGAGQVIAALVIARLDPDSLLQIGQRLARPTLLKQKLAETAVGAEVGGLSFCGLAQVLFLCTRRSARGRRRTSPQRHYLPGKLLLGGRRCVRPVPAQAGAVGDARNGELGLVKKFECSGRAFGCGG